MSTPGTCAKCGALLEFTVETTGDSGRIVARHCGFQYIVRSVSPGGDTVIEGTPHGPKDDPANRYPVLPPRITARQLYKAAALIGLIANPGSVDPYDLADAALSLGNEMASKDGVE